MRQIWSVLFVLGLAATSFAKPAEITVPLQFPAPHYTQSGTAFAVSMEGMLNTVDAGLPAVPVKILKVALPAGTTLDQVVIDEGRHEQHRGEIAKNAGMIPISWIKNPPRNLRAAKTPEITGSQYPANRIKTSLQYLHGVAIALVEVYPVVVQSQDSLSDAIDGATLHVRLLAARGGAPLRPYQAEQVTAFVDNPAVLGSYAINSARTADSYDYLIISTSDLIAYNGSGGFSDFQKALLGRQLKSKVVDMATIDQGTAGVDLPEKIRNYIRAEYKTAGIRFVLLAGRGNTSSQNFIPARNLWAKIKAYTNGQWSDDEEQIPSDMYYACLDGSFNGNHNDKWGEINDGDNGGDVDFLPEVVVGRAVLDSTGDLQNFVRKTIGAYQGVAKNTLMLGEDLFPEMHLSGEQYLDQLIGNVTEHGFTTNGYATSWAIDKLDDQVKVWSGEDALAKVSSGNYGMINHLGHSNEQYNMRLAAYFSFPDYQNQTPFFYYTQGCLAGRFTVGSFVDKMVSNAHAAFAAVANSTFGLAPEDPTPQTTKTPGASHMLHRMFIDAVMNQKGIAIGRANQVSKEAFLALKSAQEIRWVNWSANLLGDPSLQLQ